MSELIKITATGLIGGLLALTLRQQKPEIALLVSLVTSVIIAGIVMSGVGKLTNELAEIVSECGMNIKYFSVCIKAVGLAYISQFAAEILRDGGESAIASKVEAAGKVAILLLAMPVIISFLRLCLKVVNGL